MVERICIYDQYGNKICYTNHALRRRQRIPYQIWYQAKGRARQRVIWSRGWVSRGLDCWDKMELLLAVARSHARWMRWRKMTHTH